MLQKKVALMTFENDIHGMAIEKALERYDDVACYIVETDRICNSSGLNWSSAPHPELSATVPAKGGEEIDVSQLDIIWWRRTTFPQQVPPEITDEVYLDVINNDCSGALLGTLFNEFSGTWINAPAAISLAENKLIQLRAAQRAGFRIPQTPAKIQQRLGSFVGCWGIKSWSNLSGGLANFLC